MIKHFVLDASALIAFFKDEKGSGKVEAILQSAKKNRCAISMNKLNLLEIFYGVYRDDGKEKAEETLKLILGLPLKVVDVLSDDVFKEAGRLKATYKISLADSIAVAEAKAGKALLVTTDHHELDALDKSAEVKFFWIR